MKFKVCLLLALFFATTSSTWAQEDPTLSGQISEEGGLVQDPATGFQTYQYSRFLLRSRADITPELSVVIDGEVDRQTASGAVAPHWLTYVQPNRVSVEADGSTAYADNFYLMARLDRTLLKWISGGLEVTAGLQDFNNSSTNFYSPTHYFNPLPPLAWVTDEPLGSEGLNVDCFLFDDLSLEGSVRWLGDGNSEFIAQVINKGIGISITPSFAWLEGRNGVGLDLSGTFPDFQVRLEGVNWFYPDNSTQLEWTAGVSTLVDRTKLTLEGLQDSTGEALGGYTNGDPGSFYLFASAQRDFTAQWQAEQALVKSTAGGPFLLWPKVTWKFATDWKLSLQAQWMIGDSSGPLSFHPGQTGLSAAYSF